MRKLLEILHCPTSLVTRLTSPTFEDIKLAIWKQQLQKISQLLNEGAPTHQKTQSILHFAVTENKLEAIEYITSLYPDLVNEKNENGDTPIMMALFAGNLKMVKILLPQSIANVRDSNGNTAFSIAAANGNILAMEAMLEAGHNPLSRNFQGQTALHRACYYGQLESIKFLLQRTPLKLSQTDRNNNTSLHISCMSCNIVCIRYIVSKIKDASILLEYQNKEGKDPLLILEEMILKLNEFKKEERGYLEISFEDVKKYVMTGLDAKKL